MENQVEKTSTSRFFPLMAFRYFAGDPGLMSRRDLGVLVLFGVELNNVVGATLGFGNPCPWRCGPVE